MTGSIPSSLGNLTNLTFLGLDNNQLTGSIPSSLGNLTNLTHLWLSSNQLTGSIPSSLGNLTNLAYLDLSSNQLTGSIPSSLGNLTNLDLTFGAALWLFDNQLSGSIPAALCRFEDEINPQQGGVYLPCEQSSATEQSSVVLSVRDARVQEAVGAAVAFAVTLSRAASDPVTVGYATRDGSARAGEDYAVASGTLTFEAGESSKMVAVEVLDDAHDEGEETFVLALSNVSGARLEDAEATGTIRAMVVSSRSATTRWFNQVLGREVDDSAAGLRQRRQRKRDIQTKVITTLFALFAEVERDLISESPRPPSPRSRACPRTALYSFMSIRGLKPSR